MPLEETVKSKRTRKPQEQSAQVKHLCHVHDEVKNLEYIEDVRKSVCVPESIHLFAQFEGKSYCLFHHPTKEKNIDMFEDAFQNRLDLIKQKIERIETEVLEDLEKAYERLCYDFRYVWFPSQVKLSDIHFKVRVLFNAATFSSYVSFDKSIFEAHASFYWVKFFSDTFFDDTQFMEEVSFNSAIFEKDSDVFFRRSRFEKPVDFQNSRADGYLRFSNLQQGAESKFDFQEAAFEKASRISFHTVRLQPNWFVNIDSRKFNFTNIAWVNHRAGKDELKAELKSIEERGYKEPDNYRLLTIAFRNLADNSEEFNRLEDASAFRRSAFECERLERHSKRKDWNTRLLNQIGTEVLCWKFLSETKNVLSKTLKLLRTAPYDAVHFLYRILSRYGEAWFRAFAWLFLIWIAFGVGYWLFGEFGSADKPESLAFWKSFGYSLFVMTLQKPEPRPLSSLTYILYGLETIFAPLQAALLALAIRRKFMR